MFMPSLALATFRNTLQWLLCTVLNTPFSILAIRHTILICRHAAGAFIESGPRVPTRNVPSGGWYEIEMPPACPVSGPMQIIISLWTSQSFSEMENELHLATTAFMGVTQLCWVILPILMFTESWRKPWINENICHLWLCWQSLQKTLVTHENIFLQNMLLSWPAHFHEKKVILIMFSQYAMDRNALDDVLLTILDGLIIIMSVSESLTNIVRQRHGFAPAWQLGVRISCCLWAWPPSDSDDSVGLDYSLSLSLISVSNNGLVSDNNSLGNPQLLFSNLNINASLSITIQSSELVLVFIIHQGSEHWGGRKWWGPRLRHPDSWPCDSQSSVIQEQPNEATEIL